MFKSKKYTIITSILIVSMSSFSSAHSGRTDASGGHRDNKNKSGLGSYPYHCGGHPAHLHTNGCPYKSSSTTTNTITSVSQSSSTSSKTTKSSVESAKKKAKTDGYNQGYKDGYNNYAIDTSSYSGSYDDEYNEGYENGYSEGSKKLEVEVASVKESGYNIGLSGTLLNNTYTNKSLSEAYEEGYKKGFSEYKEVKIEEYTLQGKNDSYENKDMIEFPDDIQEEFKNAYIQSYNDAQEELKNKYYMLGFNSAIKGEEYKSIDEDNEKYIGWFKDGYDSGISSLEEELEKAYNLGYEGEDLYISEEMDIAKEVINESYVKGVSDKKQENTLGIVGLGGIAGIGGLIYHRKRKKAKL